MDKDLLLVIALLIIFGVTITIIPFIESLPYWCANPSGEGNWIIQPLCK